MTIDVTDVSRGPGQPLDVPASTTGLAVGLSDGTGVNQVDFTLNYNAALLTVTAVNLAAGLPGDTMLTADFATPGLVTVSVSSVTGFAAGAMSLVTLTADIPVDAPYGSKTVLDLAAVQVNSGAILSRADDAVQVVAYLGDTTGNAGYSSLDGQRIFRVIATLDSGFDSYPNLDPAIVGDVTGDGTLSSLDGTRVFQEIVGLDQIELPAIPSLIDPIVFGGLDPTLSLPNRIQLRPGDRFNAQLKVDTIPAGLEALQFELSYDPDVFTVEAVTAGELLDGFSFFWANTATPGRIWVDASNGTLGPIVEDGGVLVTLELKVKETAPRGRTMLDLQSTLMNDGRYTLIPEPQVGFDGTDGTFRIRGKRPPLRPLGRPLSWFSLHPSYERAGASVALRADPPDVWRWPGFREFDAWDVFVDMGLKADLDGERPDRRDR